MENTFDDDDELLCDRDSTVPAVVAVTDAIRNTDYLGHVLDATKQGRDIYVLSEAGVLTPDDIWDIIESD